MLMVDADRSGPGAVGSLYIYIYSMKEKIAFNIISHFDNLLKCKDIIIMIIIT